MNKEKTNLEVVRSLLTALIPKMDNATKRQMLSLITLVMASMFVTTSFVPAVSAGGGVSYVIDKTVAHVGDNGPEGNVTKAGDVIGYQVNVTNDGYLNLTNVTVTDPLINNLTGPTESNNNDAVLEVGENWIYTGNYTVTQEDMNNNGTLGDGYINNNATVDCEELDPQNDTVQVSIEQNANCTIDKTVIDVSENGPTANVTKEGDVITYQVNVTNDGNLDFTNVTVKDSLINLTGNNDTVLNVGENWTYTGNYTVTREDITNNGTVGDGFITNNVTVDCDQLDPQNDSVQVPIDTACSIDKTVINVNGNTDGNVTAAGDIITYQVKVTNDGKTDLTNVTVIDALINLTGPVESSNDNNTVLNVGENWTYTGNYTVTQEDLNSNGSGTGFINNNATINCDQLGPKNDTVQVPIEWDPSYTIDKTVADVSENGSGGNVTKTGDIISYFVNVTNDGNVDLNNVTVSDPLINDLTGPVESSSNNTVLNVGETWTYIGNHTITREDITNNNGEGFINNATVDSDQLDPQNDSVQVPIDPYCSIDQTVTDVAGQGPGGNVTASGNIIGYQVNVTNGGKIDLTNATVTDSLIDELVGPIESSNFDDILEVGETWTYFGNYSVTQEDINSNGTVGDGFIKNTASFDCDQLGPKNDTAQVPIKRTGDYSIFKSVIGPDEDGDCIVNSPGDEVPYRIVVKNEGNVDLTGISVEDSKISLTGPTGDDNDGVLNPGETWAYTGIYTLTPDDINSENDYIDNIATVSSNELPAKSSSVSQPIQQKTDLSISKSIIGIDEAGDWIINEPGDVVNYQIVVKNNGDVDLTDVSVSDPMVTLTGPTGDSADPGVLNPGELWVFAGDYEVTQADINSNGDGDGFIENTATVSCNELSDESSSIDLPIIRIPPIIIVTPETGDSKVQPVADFSANPTNGYAPLSVQFTDKSQNAASRSWDFNSDGTADSSDASPVYTYTTPGTYTAKLTVSNANGTTSKTAPITVLQATGSSGGSSHSSGGSGSPVVVSTGETTSTGNVIQPENNTQNQEQDNLTTAANVEQTPQKKNETKAPAKQSKKTPGFGIMFGITGLLAVFLFRRK